MSALAAIIDTRYTEPLTPLAPAQAEIERLRERCIETNMLAHRWMAAHDKLKAGLPYDLPAPADVPESEARALAAEAQVKVLSEALGRLEVERKRPDVRLIHLKRAIAVQFAALQQKGVE